MPTPYYHGRLIAHAGTRQVEVAVRADAAADAVDRAIGRAWRDVLALLRTPGLSPWEAQPRALRLFRGLRNAARQTLANRLAMLWHWGHGQTAAALAGTLPLRHLARAAGKRHRLTEGIDWADLLAPLREPTVEALSDEEQRDLLSRLLFPPPAETVVQARVDRLIAPLVMQGSGDRVPPELLANQLAAGYAAGKAPREIAKELLPLVNDVKASARRVARTWSMHVAHESQMEAHAQLGDLIVGFQIHATLDEFTRQKHASRNGTVYYAKPGPGQLGYDSMPRPPQEADGSIAWC